MSKIGRLVAACGEYTDHNGDTKVRWTTIGSMFQKDGRYSIKLDSIPVGTQWDGWVTVFEDDEKSRGKPKRSAKTGSRRDPQAPGDFDPDEDIPF